MAYSVTKLILKKFLELGEIYIDAFFPKKYSCANISRQIFGLDSRRGSSPPTSTRTFSSIMSRLKKQGLIATKQKSGRTFWALTSSGKATAKKFHLFDIPPADGITRLVIFDVPEKPKGKRHLLRAELRSCNYKPLQKSVWKGENPLPEDFLEFLDKLSLAKYVHIFEVTKYGTLQNPHKYS